MRVFVLCVIHKKCLFYFCDSIRGSPALAHRSKSPAPGRIAAGVATVKRSENVQKRNAKKQTGKTVKIVAKPLTLTEKTVIIYEVTEKTVIH